jgi:hypothetical protein
MTALTALLIIGAVAVVVVIGMLLVTRQVHRSELRHRFGSEYERAVEQLGSERAAERELRARYRRVRKLHLRPLNEKQQVHVMTEWTKIQARFVENPAGAARTASALIKFVLHERGYGSERFEQRMADLSVDYPRVVEHYRAARALTDEHPLGTVGTEDLRQALVHFRIVLEELSEPSAGRLTHLREARAMS